MPHPPPSVDDKIHLVVPAFIDVAELVRRWTEAIHMGTMYLRKETH
jgi:hypothetical protein